MTDVFNKKQRSEVMRSVKSQGNRSTEQMLVSFFKSNKITGWRRNYKLLGRPDFVFPNIRVVVFADGCFWHGHDCRNTRPKQNSEYWNKKRNRNIQRDLLVSLELSDKGWAVVRVWECEIKNRTFERKILKILQSKVARTK